MIDTLELWLLSNKVIKSEKPNRKIQTNEQFVTYNVEMQDILSWSCDQFVQYVYEGLSQKSTVAANLLDSLLNNDPYDFTCDGQKGTLIWFQENVEKIQVETDKLKIWLSRDDREVGNEVIHPTQ